MEAKPLDFGQVFERTWARFTKRFATFMLYYLLALAVAGGLTAIFAGLIFGLKAMELPMEIVGTALGAVFFLLMLWLGGWALAAYYHLAADDGCGLLEAFARAKGKSLAFWAAIAIPSLATLGSLVFCLFPAFLVGALFVFVPFIFVEEKIGGLRAAYKSANLIRANFWMGVLWVFIAYVTPSIAGAIPVLGVILSLLAAPLPILMLHEVYKDYKILAPNASSEGDQLSKGLLFGLPLVLLLALLVAAGIILAKQA